MPQTAKSTLMSVGDENTLAERPLMQTTSSQGCDVFSSNFSNPS